MKINQIRLFSISTIFLVLLTASPHAAAQVDKQADKHGEFMGAMETVYPDWFKTSFMELEEDILEAKEAGKRLMLVFHQDGCPYCNAFVENNLAQKDIEETVRENFDVIEINMWGDREVTSVEGQEFTEKLFAERLGVQFTPTVLVFDESGQQTLRINGYYPPDKFRLALEYATNKAQQSQSFNEFIAERYKEPGNTPPFNPELHEHIDGDASSLAKLSRQDKPLLLLFEQSDCKNCKELTDNILLLDDTLELLAEYNVVRIDMWGRTEFEDLNGQTVTEREFARNLNVSYAPTLIFYASNEEQKKEVIRSEAWFKRFHTQSMLDYVLSGGWERQPSFQRYISARADEIRESGTDVDIFD